MCQTASAITARRPVCDDTRRPPRGRPDDLASRRPAVDDTNGALASTPNPTYAFACGPHLARSVSRAHEARTDVVTRCRRAQLVPQALREPRARTCHLLRQHLRTGPLPRSTRRSRCGRLRVAPLATDADRVDGAHRWSRARRTSSRHVLGGPTWDHALVVHDHVQPSVMFHGGPTARSTGRVGHVARPQHVGLPALISSAAAWISSSVPARVRRAPRASSRARRAPFRASRRIVPMVGEAIGPRVPRASRRLGVAAASASRFGSRLLLRRSLQDAFGCGLILVEVSDAARDPPVVP